ncbi:hypothetical protein EW15_1321 [Prochlorococcus sp. MIT 0801]|nr:hypothetical protein EW15_1321 [Prochlorococcus sp. MIT 0801]
MDGLQVQSYEVGVSKLCLFSMLISPINFIEAKPHQDIN